MQLLYNLLAIVLVVLATPVFLARALTTAGFGERLRQSLGFLPADVIARVAGRGCIWLHAASVGEIVATSPVVKEIRRQLPDYPVLISVVTETGYSMAKRIIPEADGHIYFPLDLPFLSERVVGLIRPRAFLPVETELWPNFLRAARRYGVQVMMVNGRISDKSFMRYPYLGSVLRDMLQTVARFCMQSAIDAEYIIGLGADPHKVVVTGNTKYDQTYTAVSPDEQAQLFVRLGLAGRRPVVVAGSTHKGEEEEVLTAFAKVRSVFPEAALVVAPRDIARADEIAGLAKERGFTARRRTALAQATEAGHDLVILDTIGELGRIYSIADLVFVGGSLVAKGGHNILEPAAHGKPVLVGPHMFNFKEIYALLSDRGACQTVQDGAELGDAMVRILQDKEVRATMSAGALAVVEENRGAAGRTVLYLKELMACSETRQKAE
ncbi:3-deoxy-D-manno-octulosonic acid transferase [Sporolituus thermophilus]|uniref:3-deoxy-D-manno-octulosonic acid transferase n=1 Tax=Sporolituus thermophilus DSM 23256 TaxID=1123285 RepID=A0A1G7NE44_9FIRM|nr:3-deoxy-D-manno-octulosonic acid transferase [Sporolituus thermophilus]SDF72303.1 3-deoxy-D-manno-octulosonic-acid transferase [Sporolituus thermophilus DSM 23256]